MNDYDVIIIGAGAAGLMAAYQLSDTGKNVLILEARDRIGGRIYTTFDDSTEAPIERGAEFIHGRLPASLALLQTAGLTYTAISGRPYTIKNGAFHDNELFGAQWNVMLEELAALRRDMSITDFLETRFKSYTYSELKQAVYQFVQGFDAADPQKVSAYSLRNEWTEEDSTHQYRIDKGYCALVQWMADECLSNQATICLSHVVKQIQWQKDKAIVHCANRQSFTAGKVVITIPLGVWQSGMEGESSIRFAPELNGKQKASIQMGFGDVIKVNAIFTEKAWEMNKKRVMRNAGFIFSDTTFPTWWTQNPGGEPLLSGWLAGPPAGALKNLETHIIQEKAIESLAYIFNADERFIRQKLQTCIITNWGDDPYAYGAYSYETLQSASARKILREPVEQTLFFAGEALYDGPHRGTVEAALVSGKDVAATIINAV